MKDFGRLREEAGRLRKTTEDYGRLQEEAGRLRKTTGRSRKITEDYGKKVEEHGRLREEAGRLRKTTGRSRKITEDYWEKPEDYGRLREEAGGRGGGGGGGEIQSSRNPEIQKSRDPEIQKSRNPADVETSPKGRRKGHIGYIYIYIYLHNHIHIKLIESISTKATQNTPLPCRKRGPFWTRHGVGGFCRTPDPNKWCKCVSRTNPFFRRCSLFSWGSPYVFGSSLEAR